MSPDFDAFDGFFTRDDERAMDDREDAEARQLAEDIYLFGTEFDQ